jgi:hypothetical protein
MIEVRYAQFLSAFLVTMMFSSGIPGLYLVMFLKLFLIYWADKFSCNHLSFILYSFNYLQDSPKIWDRNVLEIQGIHAIRSFSTFSYWLFHVLQRSSFLGV